MLLLICHLSTGIFVSNGILYIHCWKPLLEQRIHLTKALNCASNHCFLCCIHYLATGYSLLYYVLLYVSGFIQIRFCTMLQQSLMPWYPRLWHTNSLSGNEDIDMGVDVMSEASSRSSQRTKQSDHMCLPVILPMVATGYNPDAIVINMFYFLFSVCSQKGDHHKTTTLPQTDNSSTIFVVE